jgi:hypothetical protein
MGDLITVFVQKSDVQDGFQLLIVVIPDIGIRALGLQEAVTLFPDADRVGFHAGQVLQIFNGKCVHDIINAGKIKMFNYYTLKS